MQKENCNTNISDTKISNTKQETHGVKECCTNPDEDLKMITMSMGQIAILI